MMSVVIGGLVLVMVPVVVGVAVVSPAEEKEGSTKFSGACSGSLNCRDTHDAEVMSTAIKTSAAMLAPSSVEVLLCQGTAGGSGRALSSRSGLVTATDSNRGAQGSAGQPNWGTTLSAKNCTWSRSDMSRSCR